MPTTTKRPRRKQPSATAHAPGDRVAIFADPLTADLLEGEATLVRPHPKLRVNADGTENWIVRFPDAPGTYNRRLAPIPTIDAAS